MVVDTDILIDHFHGNVLATEFIRTALLQGEMLHISAVTVAEILAGMRSGEEEDTESLFALFAILAADEAIARIAGSYLKQYARNHHLDLGDALIAATAKVTDSAVYTRNIRHYPMEDIHVIVPYQRGS